MDIRLFNARSNSGGDRCNITINYPRLAGDNTPNPTLSPARPHIMLTIHDIERQAEYMRDAERLARRTDPKNSDAHQHAADKLTELLAWIERSVTKEAEK